MIGAELGGAPHAVDPGSRSAPVVRFSLGALARNAAGRGGAGTVADLRADAWGHGAARVARTLVDAGIECVVVDRADLGAVLAAGIAPERALASGEGNVDLAVLYGLGSSEATPVMRLCGTVLSVKDLRAGEGVSYGYLHRASADTRVALVSGGYAQGIVRGLGGHIHAAIAGERHPVIGRIAMDACVVDIADAAVRRGDEVSFFGDPDQGCPSLSEWTATAGLTAAELVTAVGRRSEREYIE